MVTNVSEKDKTLQEIIAWCERLETEGRRQARPVRLLYGRGNPADSRRKHEGDRPMSGLEWPADLTDFRLPSAWDGQRIDWHGWHPPIKACWCSDTSGLF